MEAIPEPMPVDIKLNGTSLAERYKQFNKLLHDATSDDLSQEKIKDYSKKSQAEQIYITKLADRFKDGKLLCELLQSQNETVVSFALHAKWFFNGQSHLELVDPDFMIDKVFPNASYHAICRIINAFSVNLQNETLAEKYYKKVLMSFGKNMAVKFLPVCSYAFIKSSLKRDSVWPLKTLQYIYKKDPQLIQDYLEDRLQKLKEEDESKKLDAGLNSLWILMAENHTEWFVKIFEVYLEQIYVRLGKRTTVSVLKELKYKLIEEPKKYTDFFHLKTIFVTLKGQDLEKYLFNHMDENEEKFHYSYSILCQLQSKLRTRLLLKLYPLKYGGKSILDRENVQHYVTIEHLPKDIRTKWIDEKIKKIKPSDNDEDEDNNSQEVVADDMCRTDFRVMLKKRKGRSSGAFIDAAKRIKSIKRMLDCCKINKDDEELLQVLDLVVKRYRNDRPHVILQILMYLHDNFKLNQLSTDHWSLINELIELLWSKNDTQWTDCLRYYLTEYIHFCLKNGVEYESTVDKYIKYNFKEINLLKKTEHEFILHDLFVKKYKELIDADPESNESYNYITMLVESFEKRSDSKKISVADCMWLMELLKNKFSQGPDGKIFGQQQLLSSLQSNVRTRQMFGSFLLDKNIDVKLIDNFLKHNSKFIIDSNITRMIENISLTGNFKKYLPVFHKIRTYYMKPLGEHIINELKKKISDVDSEECDKMVLYTLLLCLLIDVEESEELIKPLLPVETKISDNVDKKLHTAGEIMGSKLKHIKPPIKFDILLNLARGDYLKFALPSLLSLVFKKPLQESQNLVVQLTERPVSIKKHGIRLAYFFYPRTKLLALYSELWDREKNRNVREALFQRTFKFIQTVETLEEKKVIWTTLKHFLSSFSKRDVNLYSYLTKSQCFPPELINDYLFTCWHTAKMLKSQKIDMSSTLESISDSILENIEVVDYNLAHMVIVEYLNSLETKGVSYSLLPFLVDYLINVKDVDSQEKILQLTCAAFKKMMSHKWDYINKDGEYEYRQFVYKFIRKICKNSLKSKATLDLVSLLEHINNTICSLLPLHSVFNYHVILTVTIRFLKLFKLLTYTGIWPSKTPLTDSPDFLMLYGLFGETIADYLNTLVTEYSTDITIPFIEIFDRFNSKFYNNQTMHSLKLQFILGLIKGEPTRACLMMAVYLIVDECYQKHDEYDNYMKILDDIKNKNDKIVHIILNNKMTAFW